MHPSTTGPHAPLFANAAIACFAVFTFGLAVMHLLRPDYAPSTHMISDYAVGRWGSVMTAAFACISLGSLMLSVAFAGSVPGSMATWLVTALFAITAMGSAITAVFPTDLPGAPSTTSGNIHAMSFYVNVASLVLAAVTIAVVSLHNSRWRTHRSGCVGFALLLILALFLQFKTLHPGMPYGLANRLFVVIMMF
ncbi:DUF998 domain-containing protein [Dyella amyloliquefaciens]|uniref:DUF998 domain-containing protein n=1 Tax=Dyella amyloliquefaciens TaxID=1770545 RepID=UPI00102EAD52|nr:DUF998 domain-containing protein [Dyella amyloliquefaciens]